MTAPLTPLPRPAFDAWLRLHGKDYAWAAEQLGCTREYVRLLCQPFDASPRRDVTGPIVRKVIRLTNGAVRADDWHPPVAEILNARAA